MTSKELREKYLEFFKGKEHAVIASASLIPENDPTVLFTTAGMHPLVPYLLGEKHPAGKRLVDFQKCIRTGDIDEVGDDWHLTFFEMLGNWSLNDYWKRESLGWSLEFLTSERWLNILKEKLAVSVFAGDSDAPFDQESYDIWKDLGIPEEKIYKYEKSENWWGPAGQTGPCGPDSEIFYITDKEPCGSDCQPSCSCGRYVEIWNNVFMEYYKDENGIFQKADQRNVDTGMGLERTVAILNKLPDIYSCPHIEPIVEEVNVLRDYKNLGMEGVLGNDMYGKKDSVDYEKNKKAIRVIVDHIRAATFILGDERGIEPSNVDQGYVLRRLIRRAVRFGRQLGIQGVFTFKIAEVVIRIMGETYPELQKNKDFIVNQLVQEEEKFALTLEKGLKEFQKMSADNLISGKEAFILFSTYGFPFEMTAELAKEKGVEINKQEFDEEFKKHQELSRAGAEQKFKGGLADASEQTCKLHTATHLLQSALKKVLGEHVQQKGSNITVERLRFDFTHPEKMSDEQLKQVENLVNDWIRQNVEVKCEELPYETAKERGATGLFTDKYGEVVKVYSIGDVSCEMCGGPHATRTGELGHFRIIKEEAISAGVRRIKAVLE
ncbi:alanine--tRNA ligase [Patescibacteria group bacterium]|nr:alanine--tRNA ligase [Patescibacteria group bacterium]